MLNSIVSLSLKLYERVFTCLHYHISFSHMPQRGIQLQGILPCTDGDQRFRNAFPLVADRDLVVMPVDIWCKGFMIILLLMWRKAWTDLWTLAAKDS